MKHFSDHLCTAVENGQGKACTREDEGAPLTIADKDRSFKKKWKIYTICFLQTYAGWNHLRMCTEYASNFHKFSFQICCELRVEGGGGQVRGVRAGERGGEAQQDALVCGNQGEGGHQLCLPFRGAGVWEPCRHGRKHLSEDSF